MNDWKKIWLEEENYAFSGWDFSHQNGRVETEPLPWEYRAEALDGLLPQHKLLDMDTGGGEFLLKLGHPYGNTAVTEAYAPNVALCRERLAPLGVEVVEAGGESALPFADEQFDRVINRHGSYLPSELYRILKPGGRFVTQQVGAKNCFSMRARLGFALPDSKHDLAHEAARFEAAGFTILKVEEYFNYSRYLDTGAVVFQAKIIEWEYPGFSVEKNWAQLVDIQREIEEKGFYETHEHRFLIVAEKKA